MADGEAGSRWRGGDDRAGTHGADGGAAIARWRREGRREMAIGLVAYCIVVLAGGGRGDARPDQGRPACAVGWAEAKVGRAGGIQGRSGERQARARG